MAFPYTYSKTMHFDDTEYWVEEVSDNFSVLINEIIKNKGYDKKGMWFISSNSFLSIPFKFNIQSEKEVNKVKITYKLHVQNLVNGIIVLLLLSAFFSKLQFDTFLWFSFLIALAFYIISLIVINIGIQKQVHQILNAYKRVRKESDIEHWVKEKDRSCPACGSYIQSNELFCGVCGLKVRQNAYAKSMNPETKTEQQNPKEPRISYHYNKDKKPEQGE